MKQASEVLNTLELDGAFAPVLEDGWHESMAALPAGGVSFTEPEFLRTNAAIAGLDDSLLPLLEMLAARLRAEESLRLLAWHAHHTLCYGTAYRRFQDWPELDRVLGGQLCGMFYLLIGLSAIPVFAARYRELGLPERYAEDSAKWLSGTVAIYRGAHNGTAGHTRQQLHWVRNYVDGKLFRIGRFEFMCEEWPKHAPVSVYRSCRNGQVVALAAPETHCSTDGMVLYRDQPRESAAFVTARFCDEDAVTGYPISPAGRIVNHRVRLSKEEWREVLTPGDFAPGIHIPGGGNMNPEVCRESLREAIRFFATYFPEKRIRAFTCSSWIFNPDWERLMPESNLTKFLQRCYLYPQSSGGKDGLFFLFGRDHGDWAGYPRDNSARRAMLRILEEGGRLRSEGMFFLPEELEQFDAKPYRLGWEAFAARAEEEAIQSLQ